MTDYDAEFQARVSYAVDEEIRMMVAVTRRMRAKGYEVTDEMRNTAYVEVRAIVADKMTRKDKQIALKGGSWSEIAKKSHTQFMRALRGRG